MLERIFIKSDDFTTFQTKCNVKFKEGWAPSLGQPSVSNSGSNYSSVIYLILLERNLKETKKEF